jgi:hypothetical protein
MIKRVSVLVMAVVLAGWAGAYTTLGAQQTWTGMVSDSTCGGDHGGEIDVRECTLKCIRNHDQYVLATDNGLKVIPIANQDFAALPGFAGDIVKVTGELKGGAIVISRIEKP